MLSNGIEKIKLREIQESDAVVLMQLNNDKEIANMLVGNSCVVTMEQQLAWMNNLRNESNIKRWMIDFEGETVGTVFLSSIDMFNGVANVNIKLLPNFHGKGIAKNAVKKTCEIAFNEMNLFCVTANVLSYNVNSQRLFERLGFHRDGILRSRVVKNGERYDLFSYSLLKKEIRKEE